MNYCKKCGAEISSRFCPECGYDNGNEKICPNCKTEITGRFCGECGYDSQKAQKSTKKFNLKEFVNEHKKGVKIASFSLLSVVVIAIVSILTVSYFSNIFRIGKVSKIEIGMSVQQVEKILGEPSETTESGNTYYWYEKKITKKIEKAEKILEEAFESEDENAIEKAIEEYDKIWAEIGNGTFKSIVVDFDGNGKVKSVFFNKQSKYNEGLSAYKKEYKKATLNFSSLDGSIATIDGNNKFEISGDYPNGIPYSVKYKDGSYYLNSVSVYSLTVEKQDGDYFVSWEDELGKYSAKKKINLISEYSVENGVLTSCKTTQEVFTIPNTVTEIGANVFEGNKYLKSVTIPKNVTSIGYGAFYDCTALEEINFNAIAMDDLSSDNRVFSNAGKNGKGIKVTIGKEVTKIPAYLFCPYYNDSSYSPKITSVTFEEGSVCESIGDSAFSGCTSLTSVNIGNIASWCNIEFGNSSANPLYYAKNLYISGELVTNLVIPDSVKEIKAYAFYNCDNLKSVTIGENVTSIGYNAFYYCDKLIDVYNLSSLNITAGSGNDGCVGYYAKVIHTSLDEESALKTTKDGYVFAYVNDSEIHLVDYVGNETELTLPENYNENNYKIDQRAFHNRDDITKVTIPDSVTSIGNEAFSGCTALTEIKFNAIAMDDLSSDNRVFSNAGKNGKGIKVTIGKDVTKIPAYLFYSSSNSSYSPKITSVTFEEGSVCESIGEDAFKGCTSLTSITIPSSVTSIGNSAFYNCTSLTSITIPESVTTIGNSAFYNCESLVSVTFEEGSVCEIIGERAFYGCSSLTIITIPDSVTSIGVGAFYNCSPLTYYDNAYYIGTEDNPYLVLVKAKDTSITSCIINENTKFINSSAFSGCTALTEINFNAKAMDDLSKDNYVFSNVGKNGKGIKVTIGKEVTKIPAYLFNPYSSYSSYSPKITSVTFEEGSVCESIGDSAFSGCTSLTSVNYLGTIEQWCNIEFSNNSANPLYYAKNLYISGELVTELVIPDAVTKIRAYAFSGYTSLTSVTFEEGSVCESIGNAAFYNCTSLTSITIPSSVTSIGNSAFCDCTSLTNITIPDSVTSIGKYAFSDCTSLKSATIGEGVTNLPEGVLSGCSSLESLTIPFIGGSADATVASESTLFGYIFGTSRYIGGVSTKQYYDYSSSQAYYIPSSLKNVTVTGGNILYGAFYNCSNLTSINIPDSVTSIGDYAFKYCSSLSYNEYDNAYYLGNKDNPYVVLIKAKDTSITSCTINENTKFIYEDAFYNCRSLTSITIPSSVTNIGDDAFSGCDSLTSVTIGNSVKSIGEEAFDGCTSLTSVNYLGTIEGWCNIEFADSSANPLYYANNLYINGELVTKLVIPDAVTKIKAYAFCDCTSLTSITIPDSVTIIGMDAFYKCAGLTSVTFEEGSVCEIIGERAFYGCSSLTIITIPDSVTSIGDYAFYGCDSLTSVTIGDSVTSIGDYAFAWCSSLTSVTIPDSVTSIGSSAFYNCESLTSVTIGDSVTSIGDHAFRDCTGLTSVTIGDSVTSIGDYAFAWCDSLTSVTFEDSDGWYVTRTEDAASGTSLTLTNASTNATYLKDTYDSYYWYKK